MSRALSAAACVALAFVAAVAVPPAVAQDILYQYTASATDHNVGEGGVVRLGDVDQDGTTDFAFTLVLLPNTDAIRVCSGATGLPLYTVPLTTHATNQLRIESCGDVDSDGITDFAAGSAIDNRVLVFSGASGALWYAATGLGGTSFGYDVNGAGDVDADGVPDVIGGTRGSFGGSMYSARVHSGATGSLLLDLVGPQANDVFGYSVDGATDGDGDGHDDLVIGAPYYDGPLVSSGGVFFRSGANGAPLGQFAPFVGGALLGTTVRCVDDTNLDGVADVAVANEFPFEFGLHRIRLISGASFGQLAQQDGFEGNGDIDLAPAGDCDGDGRADLWAGGNTDQLPWYSGASGSARLLSGADLHLLDLLQPGSNVVSFGNRIDPVGDLNQDGKIEVMIGAVQVPSGSGAATGMVQVISTCAPSATRVGTGCPSAGGIPSLAVAGCSGDFGTLSILIEKLPNPVFLAISLGAANLTFPGGCALLLDPTTAVFLAAPPTVDGETGWMIGVPGGMPALTLRMQALGVQPPFGKIVTTNAMSVPIG